MQRSDITTITAQFFQPALSVAATTSSSGLLADRLGMVVTDLDDIAQCLDIILHTPLGSDPQRPTFGAEIDQYIDWPLSAARPRIAREVSRAVGVWEPRVSILKVSATSSEIARLVVGIAWQPSGNYGSTPVVTNLAFGRLAS
ncbi:GPW/gp25 family protein [Burkholderia cenocepacia]|uniref:GPW/gp25 family protein n=1 Tax=Burkholderia cenocepacia TaxID=95486 RepID=UPI001AA0CEA3|nr:GPW/gp25 family protein [Burkholderia cenocepacia]MBO1856857.1 GPW/gp25 family protein [Burkholderia cenocepacia]